MYVPRMRKRCGWVGNILRRPRLYRDEVKVLSGCVALRYDDIISPKRDGEISCHDESIANKTFAAAALSRSGRYDERFEPLYPRLEEIFGW